MKESEIILLTGFLGSGKTTLLQRLLEEEKRKGRKVAVLMNEMGDFSVDSDIIGDNTPLKELLNGCICCTMKDDVEITLLSLYQEHRPDVIYIEATGVAHPIEIVDVCLSPVIAPYISIRSVVGVVDPLRWLHRRRLNIQVRKLVTEQVKHADVVLINKSDLLTSDQRSRIDADIKELNPSASRIFTTYSSIGLDDLPPSARFIAGDHEQIHVHHHLHIHSFTYSFEGPIYKKKFEEWIKGLPNTIYRIKGFIRFEGEEGTTLFQYAYGVPHYQHQLIKFPANLVVIGEEMNRGQLMEELRQLEQSGTVFL
ncbi:GTP-binding protein [Bacillus sp. RO3]|nr:GTP-binding protein [Bacillus sp. RO3]